MEPQPSKILLNVPFYTNTAEPNECFQIAMQSILKYYLDQDFTVTELNALTHRKSGQWTGTVQIVPPLFDLGLQVKYFSKADLRENLRGEAFIREQYGKDAEKILALIDVPTVMEATNNVLKNELAERRVLSISEIEDHIGANHLPIALLDWSKVLGLTRAYQGHMGVITGFDADNFYFHDSGPLKPEPNMPIRKSLFLDAWNAPGTDNDMVIVYGRR